MKLNLSALDHVSPLSRLVRPLFFAFLLGLACITASAQHGHLNAGAYGTNLMDKLYFVNGALFAAESGYVKTMNYTDTGTYKGYYAGNISFTALPATTNLGGPAFGAPALGSFIVSEIASVEGPAGGAFGFWEGGARVPTYSVPTGTAEGTNYFELSDISIGAGLPDADPYGHIHGRQFTVTKPGIYTVGFKLYDLADYYPVHSPSDILYIKFAAGYMLESIKKTNGALSFNINTGGSTNLYVQSASTLTGTNLWTDLVGPLITATNPYVFVDTNAPLEGARFYRIVEKTP